MPHSRGCDRISQNRKFLSVRISDDNGPGVRSIQMANGGSHKPEPKNTKGAPKKGAESGKKGTKK